MDNPVAKNKPCVVLKFPIRFKVGDFVKSTKVTGHLGTVLKNYKSDQYLVRFEINGGELTALHKGNQLEAVRG